MTAKAIENRRRRLIAVRIIEATTDVLQTPVFPEDVRNVGVRVREVVRTREMCVLMLRLFGGYSFPEIASLFNTENHSTMVAACRRARENNSEVRVNEVRVQVMAWLERQGWV